MIEIPDPRITQSPTVDHPRAFAGAQAKLSLLRAGLATRLAIAGGLTGCLWLAVLWAIH